ncbi:MAG: hypothetical protein GY951_08915 [Psychromonas sp.]|nr:hypothetical protein [Psychromonas sp.]
MVITTQSEFESVSTHSQQAQAKIFSGNNADYYRGLVDDSITIRHVNVTLPTSILKIQSLQSKNYQTAKRSPLLVLALAA